jgi:hydrogenase small subunit
MVVEVKPEVRPKLGMVGNVAGATTEEIQRHAREQLGRDSLLGPYTHVHVFWLAGMSCDGCTISVLGAVAPRVEDLLMGSLPGLPQILLHHTAVNVESGDPFVEPMQRALEGTLGAPYVIVYEGSVPDERRAGEG